MPSLTFHLIPHTHWDREWYLSHAVFRARLVGALDDLIHRLRAEPGITSFLLDGQTVHLEDYLAVRPDQEHVLHDLIRAGRLEAGPWYVLADEQIPSAEALIRNLLLGTRDAQQCGRRMNVLYSPDAFGHPAFLPLLAREFGIAAGVLWRGAGPESTGGKDLFRWRGTAGGEMVTYHLPPQGYEIGAGLPADPVRLRDVWPEVRESLVRRAAGDHVAVFVGADHHWVHPDLVGLRNGLSSLEPGHAVRISRLEDFLAAAATTPNLSVVEGDLRGSSGYAWTLQGVHSTRAHQKRANSRLELWLERYAEPLAVLAMGQRGPDLRPLLRFAWRRLIQCQFHDAIGGCSSDPVARSVDERMREVDALAREVIRGGLHAAIGHDPDRARDDPAQTTPAVVLWNPAARHRSGLVIADLSFFRQDVLVGPPGGTVPRTGQGFQPFSLRGADGAVIPVQILDLRRGMERRDAARHYPDQDEVDVARVAFRAPEVPGLGWRVVGVGQPALESTGPEVKSRGRTLENGVVAVAIEPSGALMVRDLRSSRVHFGLLRLEVEGDDGDTYTFAPSPGKPTLRSEGPVRIRILSDGPLLGALEASWFFAWARGGIAVRLLVVLHADDPVVRCTFEIDNEATDCRLRARLPLGLARGRILAGAQIGSAWQDAVALAPGDSPGETPVATAPAHRYVAAAGMDGGLALLTPGFFEYEWTRRGDLVVTLLRAVGELSRGDLPTRPGHAGWPTPTPLAQCQGRHVIDLALAPIPAWVLRPDGFLPRLWEDTFLPLRGVWFRDFAADAPGEATGAGLELEGDDLVLTAAKPAEEGEGIVLRCHNASGEACAGAWRLPRAGSRAYRVRADETVIEELPISEGNRVRFTAGPFELVTCLICHGGL